MVIKKNENVVARKVHGSSFLIDISDNYSGDKCAILHDDVKEFIDTLIIRQFVEV